MCSFIANIENEYNSSYKILAFNSIPTLKIKSRDIRLKWCTELLELQEKLYAICIINCLNLDSLQE